jgi:hypothetical protein
MKMRMQNTDSVRPRCVHQITYATDVASCIYPQVVEWNLQLLPTKKKQQIIQQCLSVSDPFRKLKETGNVFPVLILMP